MGSSFSTTFSKSYSPKKPGHWLKDSPGGTISRMESTDSYITEVVCKEDELNENEMKVFDIGEDGKVLLVKQKGEISALGTKCSHYGAPLVSGALGDGRIRCPWHGACFNIKTGDIEDFPGFDSIPCYKVTVTEKGDVKVKAKKSYLKSNIRIKEMGDRGPCDGSTVVIVGGGPSGATCAETLRSEGFLGRIVIVAKEKYLPYDRIKVSKMNTVTDIEKLQARTQEYYNNASIDLFLGIEATKVDTKDRFVYLSDGNKLRYSAVYLASGSKPRVPKISGVDLKNIYTVRNYNDSVDILNYLGSDKNKKVVVLGLSFIGLEIAAACQEKAKSVTVVGKESAPLKHIFGKEIGTRLQKLFEEKLIKFEFKTTIVTCKGNENHEIMSVELDNGKVLKADMLILGVGTTFYTDFLKDSDIKLEANGAVNVNDRLKTSVPNVYAGGDIAFAPVFAHRNERMSIGHIGLAQYHGRIAALNILGKKAILHTVPYFWTTLFGKSIRYSGCGKHSSIHIDGNIEELKFVVFFFNEAERLIAVASCMRDPVVSQFAEFQQQGKSISKKEILRNPFGWTKMIN